MKRKSVCHEVGGQLKGCDLAEAGRDVSNRQAEAKAAELNQERRPEKTEPGPVQ